jgi:hypothetical protein
VDWVLARAGGAAIWVGNVSFHSFSRWGVDERWGEAYKTQTVAGLVDEAASGAMPLTTVDILERGSDEKI